MMAVARKLGVGGLGVAVWVGCSSYSGSGPGPVVPGTAGAGSSSLITEVAPFSVTDTTGRLLELAFLGGFNTPRPQLVDLDGDGQLDLVIQEYSRRMMYLRRDGTSSDGIPRFSLESWHLNDLDVGEWSRFVDIDSDGRVDLLAELPFSYLKLFRNTGSTSQPRFVAHPDSIRDVNRIPIFSDRQNIPQIVDLTCNGKLDLMIGRISGHILHYELARWEAVGRDSIPVFDLITPEFQGLEIITGQGSLHGANTMAFADYDRDGDLDLFWGDFFEAGLLLFENVGSCARPQLRPEPVRFPSREPLLTSGYNAPAFGDLTGNGFPDLVVGVLGGSSDPIATTIANLHWLRAESAGGYRQITSQLLPQIDVGSESIPALVDLDRDGDLDLLVANKIEAGDRRTSRIYWFENVGTPRAPRLLMRGALSPARGYHQAPAFGSLSGQGSLDMVVGGFGSRLAHYQVAFGADDAGPTFRLIDSAVVTITRGSNTYPTLGDLDGDGLLDLVVGEASGALNYYRNVGTTDNPKFELVSDEWLGLRPGRRSAPHLVDWNSDGLLDLLVGTDSDGIKLYLNTGSRTSPSFTWDQDFRLDLPPMSAPAVGDLDGDGRLELLSGTVGGGLRYFHFRP